MFNLNTIEMENDSNGLQMAGKINIYQVSSNEYLLRDVELVKDIYPEPTVVATSEHEALMFAKCMWEDRRIMVSIVSHIGDDGFAIPDESELNAAAEADY